MTVRKVLETQADTGTWAADGTIQTDLLRNGAVTRIYATAEITPSATLGGANQPNAMFRIIQNLSIAAGGQTYFTLPADDGCHGGTLLHYLNQWDGFGLGHTRTVITAPSRTYSPMVFVLHAGSRPKNPNGSDNPFDLSAFIPAAKLGRLTAQWVTSGNDVMDDTVTITSAVFRFTLAQVMAGNEAELLAEMAAQGVLASMQPTWDAERYSPTATATAYSDKRNIPVGGWVKRIVVLAQDATADRPIRAHDEVTGISVELPRDNTYLYRAFTDKHLAHLPGGTMLEADDGAPDFGGAAPEGIYVVDLRQHTTHENRMGRDYGVDARGFGRGDLLLGLTLTTNAAGDDMLILYERYAQIAGPLL